MLLARAGLNGWQLLPGRIVGKPDFVFPKSKLAVFVDGCFWYGCPKCYRRPLSNRKYWDTKILRNKKRDKRQRAKLRREGWDVLTIWEHELTESNAVVARITKAIRSNASKIARLSKYG